MTESILVLSEALETLKEQQRISSEDAESILDRAVRGEIDIPSDPLTAYAVSPTIVTPPRLRLASLFKTILAMLPSIKQAKAIPQKRSLSSVSTSEDFRNITRSELKAISKKIRNQIVAAQASLLKVHILGDQDRLVLIKQLNEMFMNLFGVSSFEVTHFAETSLHTFSSATFASSTGEAKNIANLKSILSDFKSGQIMLVDSTNQKRLSQLMNLADPANASQFVLVNKLETENTNVLYTFSIPSRSMHPFASYIKTLRKIPNGTHFNHLFAEPISTLLNIITQSPPREINHANVISLIKQCIQEYAVQSFALVIQDINCLASKTFNSKARLTHDDCDESSRLDIYEDICISLSSPTNNLSSLRFFESEAKSIIYLHRQKTKQVCFGTGDQNLWQNRTDSSVVVLDFDCEGNLIYTSCPLSAFIRSKLNIRLENDRKSLQLQYQELFKEQQSILTLISMFLNEKVPLKQNILQIDHISVEIFPGVVPPQKHESYKSNKSFSIVIQQKQNLLLNITLPQAGEGVTSGPISSDGSEKKRILPQINKIKRAMNKLAFITHTTKAAQSKQMLLKSPELKNSFLREYLPDRDLKKIEATEQKNSELSHRASSIRLHDELQITQSRRTTVFQMTVSAVGPSKPLASDFENPDAVREGVLGDFALNLFDWSEKQKIQLIWLVFKKNKYIEKYNIPMDQFCSFLHTIRQKYNKHKNPFHNFDHGISVMHGCHVISTKTRAANVLSELNQFSVVLSGLCHDISHRARTNVFEVNSMSKLAIRYHDKSVLEQHHIAVTFKVIRMQQNNILMNMPFDQLQEVRKLVISNILATDIKQHFDLLSEFEMKLNSKILTEKTSKPEISLSDQNLITNMIIHASDFHGTAQVFSISQKWSLLVNQEFKSQYQEEGEMSIPQTPYLKDLDKPDILAKNEIGFVNAIVKPLWEALSKFLGDDLAFSVTNLNNNQKEWAKYGESAVCVQSAKARKMSIEEVDEDELEQ